jgi:hypothetical protein
VTLQSPLGLLAAGLVPLIVVLYILRGIRRRRVVPSIQLWAGEAREITAHARWRRPPLEVLLLLQLAFVLLGALALSRPSVPGPPGTNIIVVLDASASMQALDGTGRARRFDVARQLVLQTIDQVRNLNQVTVIRAGAAPSIAFDGTDLQQMRTALASMTPGSAAADMQAAIDIAAAVAAEHAQDQSQAVVISDGTYAALPDPGVLNMPVRFLLVGRSAADIALTSVVARRNTSSASVLEGFASIANHSTQPVDVPVHTTADGVPMETRVAHLEPDTDSQLVFSLPPGTARFGVSLDTGDVLPLDDSAETAVDGATRRHIALVGTPSTSLTAALRALPNVDVTVVSPDQSASTAADIYVFDRFVPAPLPLEPMIVVQPPPGAPIGTVAGETGDLEATVVDPSSPLLFGVDVAALRFSGAGLVHPPTWAEAVVSSANIPLLLQGELDGRRVVVLGFDPDAAQVQQTAALPALVANSVAWVTAPPAAVNDDTGKLSSESIDITPLGHAELDSVGQLQTQAPIGSQRELWPLILLGAIGVCAAEWWYFARHG